MSAMLVRTLPTTDAALSVPGTAAATVRGSGQQDLGEHQMRETMLALFRILGDDEVLVRHCRGRPGHYVH